MLCCSNPNLAKHHPTGDRKPPLDRDQLPGGLPRVRPSRSRWSLFTSGESSSRRRSTSRESSSGRRGPSRDTSSDSKNPKRESSSELKLMNSSDRRGSKRENSSRGDPPKRERRCSERRRSSTDLSDSPDSSPTRGSSSPPLRRLSHSPRRRSPGGRSRAASLPSAKAAEAVALAKMTAGITAETPDTGSEANREESSAERDVTNGRELAGGAILWSREKSSSAGALHRGRSITRTGSTAGTGSRPRSSSSSPRRVGFTLETKGYGGQGQPGDAEMQRSGKAEQSLGDMGTKEKRKKDKKNKDTEPSKWKIVRRQFQAMRPPRLEGMALAAPITVRDGDPCHVTVEVAGIPIPDITWFHGSREIKNCSDFRVDDKGTSCTLYIAAVTEELSMRGVRVVARNRVGVETKNVELKVYKVHTKWKPIVKSESFSTRSPDTFLRNKRRRRKVQSGTSMTSLNKEGPTKPSRSQSMTANWTYRHASHSTDSILDEVFSFDRKSAFSTSTPRDVALENSQSQEINQISPISYSSPAATKETSPIQKDVMTDSGFSENIFRYRSSETDDKHIEVGRVPPIALPEDFDIEPTISPKVEERLMSPREPKPMFYKQEVAVLQTKPPTGRSTDTLPRDGRKLSANGQIWISDKKISKSLSAMQNLGEDPATNNRKYKLASQEKWESQEKVKRRSTGAQLEASPLSQQQQQKVGYEARQKQVEDFLRCDEPDKAAVEKNKNTNDIPNNGSPNPIIKRKTSSVPKRARPVSETNLDDFVVLAPPANNTSTDSPPEEAVIKEVSVTSLSKPPQTLSSLPKDESQLAKIQVSGIKATDTAVLSSANNAKLKQTPNLSGVDLNSKKDTSVALLGLTGKKGEQKRQINGNDHCLSKAEILLSVEGPSFHPEIPKSSSPDSRSQELSSVDVSQQLSKAAQVIATIEAGKTNKKDPKRKVSPSSNDKGMQWVYPRSEQEGDSKSNVNSNNSKNTKTLDTSQLPCVKVLDDAISYIYAEAFAHFGDDTEAVSSPLAQMAKKSSQEKDSKVVSQLLEYPYVYKANGVLPRLSEASDEDSVCSSQNNKENFSNNNSTKSKYAPDLLNGINTNSNNRQEPHSTSKLDLDSADVIGLSDEVDSKSLRDQVEPSQPCSCPSDSWSSPEDLEHSNRQPSTDQHLAETSTNHVNPVIEGRNNATVQDNVDSCNQQYIPGTHSKNEDRENNMDIPEETDTTLANTENELNEEDIESDDESVQTVIEVGEDQIVTSSEEDKDLKDLAHTLVDEVLKTSIEVILAEEAALEGTIDAGTEPHASSTAEKEVSFEVQEQLDTETGNVDEAVNVPKVVVDEEEDNIVALDKSQISTEDKLIPEDALIPVVIENTLAVDKQLEEIVSTAHPESLPSEVETHDKPAVVDLSKEEMSRIDLYVAEIMSEAIAIFSSEKKPTENVENQSDTSNQATAEGVSVDAPKGEPLEANESFIQHVEAWLADVIKEAIAIVADQNEKVQALECETDNSVKQQNDAESAVPDVHGQSTNDSPQVSSNIPDSHLQADLYEQEFSADEQHEGDLEHLELDTIDLLQTSRNRTSSLSSISEESEEDVSFVDETFHISDIPSTTYKPEVEEDNKLVMDTFTQIDLPGQVNADKKASKHLDRNEQDPSVSPDPAIEHQNSSDREVVDYNPEQSSKHAQQLDTDCEEPLETQEVPIVCSTTQALHLTPIAVSSDSEALESSITDENTLDLSWDSDMGPELSFTAADRMAYNLRMANDEGRVKRDSETNTEPVPVPIHAATGEEQEGIKDTKSRQDCDSELSKVDKTSLSVTPENDIKLNQGDNIRSNENTKCKNELLQNGKSEKDTREDESTYSKLSTSPEKEVTASSASATAKAQEAPPSSAVEKDTGDSAMSLCSSMMRDVLTQNQGAVLFLLVAVAVMAALSWWQPADV